MYFAELSDTAKDLVRAGAPEWTYYAGRIIGACLVIGLILFIGIKAIKKVLGTSTTKGKTTKTTAKAKKQTSKKTTKKSSDDYDDGL